MDAESLFDTGIEVREFLSSGKGDYLVPYVSLRSGKICVKLLEKRLQAPWILQQVVENRTEGDGARDG